jgi:hypothetical protein
VRRRLLAQRIEWCANQFKQRRGSATSYDKRVANYRAAVVIAELMI